MDIDFAGGSYETFSKDLNAQECVNFFTHIDQEGGVSQLSLRGTPGLKEWCDTSKYDEVRGAIQLNNYIYAVVGNAVYRVTENGVATVCTGNLLTSSGAVSISKNLTQIMIVDGSYGYIVTNIAISQITDPDFPSYPTSVTYQDGYFIVTLLNSGRAYISSLNNGNLWDGTEYFNAEGYPDNTIKVISDRRDVFMFGEKTIQGFYNSGATVPFDRKPGTAQEIGIGAKDSAVQHDNTVFFISDRLQVVRLEGYNPKVISPRAIEYQMAQDSDISNAAGMSINIEGNAFYVLTTSNNTWCYNAATNFWHQLMSYPEPYNNRWRGNCYAKFNDKHIVGDYQNGKLYELDFDTFTDNGEPIKSVRIPPGIRQEGKNVFHFGLEVFFESGVGLVSGQGSDPQAMLQYSDDGGHDWGNELWRSMGKIGKHQQRAVWNRLGGSRHRHYKLSITDPVKRVITGANLEAEVGIT